ncbi:MAG: trypsin-like peptidase domain-containing protein [Acidimicrobiia bacterium]|nr:trypsin-like peptidase domain-containing protein [Acidimicrobiia bacterium]
MKGSRAAALLFAFTLAVVGCGGDDSGSTTTQAPTTTTTEILDKDPSTSGDAVDNLQDVRGAIVRIVAEGSFADPEFGQQYNAAGSGSGFFVSSDGIAVTNNHVVTGAAFLQVYVEGEDEPRNARVLGVSECSDLAVIDVDGDGYPYLEWYEGDISAGLQIYAAGFPLGDEEYTLLDGIISKENADGESDWASVDKVVEHSADTLPGNSGGPIVTEDGKIVAVNYAGDGAGQAFGVGREEAQKVLPSLIDGNDVTSIGINGQALSDGSFSGIWVASVASGSPADLGGIESGDLVTLLEGLIPATDGTMADYCDILRSHAPGDPLSVEVYRAADDAFYEGTLNTENVLALSFSFESELQDEVAEITGDAPATVPGYDSYMTLTDVNDTITVDVPSVWTESRLEGLWDFDGELVGSAISAAPDYDSWFNTWSTPGVFFGASPVLADSWTVDSLLDRSDFSGQCDYDGRSPYSDALYEGAYDVWLNCGGEEAMLVVVVAEPPGASIIMLVQIQVISEADLEALDTILNTFVADELALANLIDGSTATGGGLVLTGAELLPGDCFNDVDVVTYGDGLDVEITTVPCDQPHDNEVVLTYYFPDTQFTSDEMVWEQLDTVCSDAWPDYVGVPYLESALYFYYYPPSAADWNVGNRIGVCVAYDGDLEPITGSVFMSGI